MRTLLATLILLTLSGCKCVRAPREPRPDEATLQVMTYNVNYGLAGDPATIAAIGSDADVVCLQETTPEWERALRDQLGEAYPHMLFLQSPQRAGGQAVLSKFPLRSPRTAGGPPGWFPALRVSVDSPLGELQLLGLHLRPPFSDSGSVISGYLQTGSWHAAELELALPVLTPGVPTIVLGDFNESSGGALDRLHELGYRDALALFDPDAETWRWPFLFTELTSALDHLVHGPALEALSAEVRRVGRSDHYPVVARFALKAG